MLFSCRYRGNAYPRILAVSPEPAGFVGGRWPGEECRTGSRNHRDPHKLNDLYYAQQIVIIERSNAMRSLHKSSPAGILPVLVVSIGAVIAMPVHGEADPDAAAQTITIDSLEWVLASNGEDIKWPEAVEYCAALSLDGHDDWRLPTLAELQSLVHKGKGYEAACGQWVKIVPVIQLTCGWVWSAETGGLGPTATVFNFDNVYFYSVRKVHRRAYRALAVRNLD